MSLMYVESSQGHLKFSALGKSGGKTDGIRNVGF